MGRLPLVYKAIRQFQQRVVHPGIGREQKYLGANVGAPDADQKIGCFQIVQRMSHDDGVIAVLLQSFKGLSSALSQGNFIMQSLQDRSAPFYRLPLTVDVQQLCGSISWI